MQKLFSIIRSHLLIVDLCVYANGVLFKKSPPVPVSSSLFFTFSSSRFSVSGLMLRSLIHLELSFVQMDKYDIFGFVYMPPSSLISPLWRRCCLFPLCISGLRARCPYACGLTPGSSRWFHWLACLFCVNTKLFYYYSSVVQLEIRDGDTSSSPLIIQDCFSYLVDCFWLNSQFYYINPTNS